MSMLLLLLLLLLSLLLLLLLRRPDDVVAADVDCGRRIIRCPRSCCRRTARPSPSLRPLLPLLRFTLLSLLPVPPSRNSLTFS